MNKQLRQFEKESGLDIYGLGARRDKWEAALEKYAELIVRECEEVVRWAISVDSTIEKVPVLIREHFGVEE